MLLEPGSCTLPRALARWGRSRNAVVNISDPKVQASALRGQAKRAPRRARCWPASIMASRAGRRPACSGLLEGLQGALEMLRPGPAPRSRLASRMSRHISGSPAAMRVKSRKPGPATLQEGVGLGLADDAVHHGKGQHVGQVADGGEGGVVRLGRHACARRSPGPATGLRPCAGGLVRVRSVGVRMTLAPRYSSASACSTPATSLPVIGVGGHKAGRSGCPARCARPAPRRPWWSRRP